MDAHRRASRPSAGERLTRTRAADEGCRVVRVASALFATLLALAACGEARRPTSPGSSTSTPRDASAPDDDAASTDDASTPGGDDASTRDDARTSDDASAARDASTSRDAAPRRDASTCTAPASQALGQPCCEELLSRACAAGLFCAAFDGATDATCHDIGARAEGETCTEDLQCRGQSCPASTGVCGPGQGSPCFAGGAACASDDGSPLVCDAMTGTCQPPTTQPPRACDLATHQGCGAGQSCVILFTPSVDVACGPTGRTGEGQMCSSAFECQRGLSCLSAMGGCIPPCSATLACPMGMHCVTVSGSDLGGCLPGP